MLEKYVVKIDKGAHVKFQGDVKIDDVQKMVDSCRTGGCGCSCDKGVMDTIEEKSVGGIDGDVTISLIGSDIEVSDIESAMQECSL